MHMTLKEDAEVITSDGKKIGNVKRIENEDYFLVYKKGFLTDEEIAQVLTYIRQGFGNEASDVSAGEVSKLRDDIKNK